MNKLIAKEKPQVSERLSNQVGKKGGDIRGKESYKGRRENIGHPKAVERINLGSASRSRRLRSIGGTCGTKKGDGGKKGRTSSA